MKNQNDFRRNRFTSQIFTIRRILEVVREKTRDGTIICKLLLTFDSIHREKIEKILLADGLPKETVVAIIMRYKNIKVKVLSSDGDTHFFDIVAGVTRAV